MKVFVTGAAGFVGRHLVRALVHAGHEVVGMGRKPSDIGKALPGVVTVMGDVTEAATVTADKMAGCDAVIHLVGIIREARSKGETFEAVHLQGTKNVLAAAGSLAGRFVYLSALGADLHAESRYARTKAQAEQAVRESGIPHTIFRPSIILGQDGEFVGQMEDLIRGPGGSGPSPPFIPVPGGGSNKFQPVYVEDLTACLVKCLEDPATANQTYEIGGATQVTFNEMIAAIERHLGLKKPLLHVPMPLMFVAASVLEAVLPLSPITSDQLLNLKRDNICDNGPVRAAFGIDPLPFERALAQVYAGRS